jgi:amino acid transporter
MATVGAAAEAAAAPEVFARKASGLIRVMSPHSAFVYNVLTMGLIFPWTYLWGPFVSPGANIALGIVIAMAAQIFISVAYVWLASAMPRSGGDYVFQSRIFGGGFGFTSVMSGFVIWILQWVALSGWLMAVLALAPFFTAFGIEVGNQWMIDTGVWLQTAAGIVTVSLIQAVITTVLLVSGFRNYVRVQRFLWVATLLAFVLVLYEFIATSTSEFVARINAFALAVDGTGGFYDYLLGDVSATGFDLNPGFALLGTFLIAPIAWTSLQWATYSVEQGSEIKSANSVRQQIYMMVGATLFVGILLAILAVVEQATVGGEFLRASGASYFGGVSDSGEGIGSVAPFPNVLAMAITASPLIMVLISLGYAANSFQVTCNCFIGMTRVLVAMSLDRTLPAWFSRVHARLRTPVNAHIAYLLAGAAVIYGFNYIGEWASWTLAVTLANGYVFMLSAVAAALLPYLARDIYRASPHKEVYGVPLITIVGGIGAAAAAAMVIALFVVDEYGLANQKLYLTVLGVAVAAAVWYIVMRLYQASRGINIELAFKAVPPE